MRKQIIGAVIVGVLIGWVTEYAFLRYEAHKAFEAQAAFIESVNEAIKKGGPIPIP